MAKLEPGYELLYKFAHAEPNCTPLGYTSEFNYIPISEFAKITKAKNVYDFMRLVKHTYKDKFEMEPYRKKGIYIRRVVQCQF